MAHDVFISYAFEDKPMADAVCHALEEARIRCWMYGRDQGAGKYAKNLVDAINDSRIMVVVFSSHCNESDHIDNEVQFAYRKGKIIIPFRIEEVEPAGALEFVLGPVNWIDALTPPIESHLKRLVENVTKLVEPRKAGGDAAASTEPPPTIDDKAPLDRTSRENDPSRAKIASLFEQADEAEKNRNWSDAVEFYEDILRLSPGHPEAEKFLAWAREKTAKPAPGPVASPAELFQPESDIPPSEGIPVSPASETDQTADLNHEVAEAESATSPTQKSAQAVPSYTEHRIKPTVIRRRPASEPVTEPSDEVVESIRLVEDDSKLIGPHPERHIGDPLPAHPPGPSHDSWSVSRSIGAHLRHNRKPLGVIVVGFLPTAVMLALYWWQGPLGRLGLLGDAITMAGLLCPLFAIPAAVALFGASHSSSEPLPPASPSSAPSQDRNRYWDGVKQALRAAGFLIGLALMLVVVIPGVLYVVKEVVNLRVPSGWGIMGIIVGGLMAGLLLEITMGGK